MKNIHVLPTDKQSRLYHWKGNDTYNSQFRLRPIAGFCDFNQNDTVNQNIYITNDEEIKDGDWKLKFKNVNDWNFKSGELQEKDYSYFAVKCVSLALINPEDKKIILTTDQDLIEDGVQSIPDEFLEWFFKNPSCEEVEVEIDSYMDKNISESVIFTDYKIIIPKEEPKQDWYCPKCNSYVSAESVTFEETHQICNTSVIVKEELKQETLEEHCSCTDECLGYLTKTCKRIEEEPKQETLEEVAERYSEHQLKGILDNLNSKQLDELEIILKKNRKLYSEEEVLAFGKSCFYKGFEKSEKDDANCYTAFREEIGSLIGQFKKK